MTIQSLVVGLGNPGSKYTRTRHNAGYMVVDELQTRLGFHSWQEKFLGEFCKAELGSHELALLKPATFMNLSGRSVARAMNFYRIEPDHVVVVHDDLDLEFGTVRVKIGGGTGGHKGIESLKTEIGSTDFSRIRIGIGRPSHGNATSFVLEPFREDEIPSLSSVIESGAVAVETLLKEGPTVAMNRFNRRQGQKEENQG